MMDLRATAAKVSQKRRESFDTLSGVGAEHRGRAHTLYQERRGLRQEFQGQTETRQAMESGIPGFFPTPPQLAERMVRLAVENMDAGAYQNPNYRTFLEPSAGTGRIVDAIREAAPLSHITMVEVNYTLAQGLEKKYRPFWPRISLYNGNFLEYGEDKPFDYVIMNPPFERGRDIKHVRHAYGFLAEGGVLVAVMSEGTFYRTDQEAVEFRSWLEEKNAEVIALDPGTFQSSGTGVNTRLVILKGA